MKLSEAKTAFYESSDTLSENARKLSFAGIAVIWVFKVGETSTDYRLPLGLLIPMAAFIGSLAFDCGQYLYKSTAWWIYYAFKHRSGVKDDDEIDPPSIINFLTFFFYYGKTIVCAVGYFWLLGYVAVLLIRWK